MDFQKVDKKLLERIAGDAKLYLEESEKEKLVNEMNEILVYFGKIRELDTKDVEPAYHAVEITNVWREDKKEKKEGLEIGLNAKELEDGYIIGPKLV